MTLTILLRKYQRFHWVPNVSNWKNMIFDILHYYYFNYILNFFSYIHEIFLLLMWYISEKIKIQRFSISIKKFIRCNKRRLNLSELYIILTIFMLLMKNKIKQNQTFIKLIIGIKNESKLYKCNSTDIIDFYNYILDSF